MTMPQTDIKMQLAELLTHSFEAFSNGISQMFDVEMVSDLQSDSNETLEGLAKRFKEPSAVITIKSQGALDGKFYVVFDKEALFTLAGTVMTQPESEILTSRNEGSTEDAEDQYDAVTEAGNLLVGSWDKVFGEALEGHVNLLQSGTFIGNPWDGLRMDIGPSGDEEFLFFPCEITVGSFPVLNCGVFFPEAVYSPSDEASVAASKEENASSEAIEKPEAEEVKAEDAEVSSNEAAIAASEEEANSKTEEPEMEEPRSEELEMEGAQVQAEAGPEEIAGGAVSQAIQKMVQSLPVIPEEHARTLLSVCAKDIMKKEVLWGTPDDSVQAAMDKMQQADAACMMVGDSGSLEGIVTWVDIAEAVSVFLRPSFVKWRRAADDATLQIKIKVIMTRPVRTINPQTSLAVIMEDMRQHHLCSLPVVNEQGQIEGVVTGYDIFDLLLKMAPDPSMTGQIPQSAELSE